MPVVTAAYTKRFRWICLARSFSITSLRVSLGNLCQRLGRTNPNVPFAPARRGMGGSIVASQPSRSAYIQSGTIRQPRALGKHKRTTQHEGEARAIRSLLVMI